MRKVMEGESLSYKGKRQGRKKGHNRSYAARMMDKRFNVYQVNNNNDVSIWIGKDGENLGIEIKGLIGIFTGNNRTEELSALSARIKELGLKEIKTERAFGDEILMKRIEREIAEEVMKE